jgi:hypothetical protein
VSTRSQQAARSPTSASPWSPRTRGGLDPVEQVALVARAKRDLLLRVHRHRLRREDLEDCLSQATLELVAHVRRGRRYSNALHVENALEQRFVSRVHDRRRALTGRSAMQEALEAAAPLDGLDGEQLEVPDVRTEPETLTQLRQELRDVLALAQALTHDQRLVLAAQLGGVDRDDFCLHYGWSGEKYRKVGQRARARLRALSALEQADVVSVVPSAVGPS